MAKNRLTSIVHGEIAKPWRHIDIDRRPIKKVVRRKGKDVAKMARRFVNRKGVTSGPGEFPGRKKGVLFKAIRERVSRSGFSAAVAPFRSSQLGDPYYPAFLTYGARGREPGGDLGQRDNPTAQALRRNADDIRADLSRALEDALRPRPVRAR